jgi:O-antigen biosynthesis protein WbqV
MFLFGEQATHILGRTYVALDTRPFTRHFSGRRVLVTGAGGSIGREVCKALSQMDCERLSLLDNNDNSLLETIDALGPMHGKGQLRVALCDVRDRNRLSHVFERDRPEIVIHAAALKHVHLGEQFPGECVLTNLIGVSNVVRALSQHGGGRFVLVSTDKAADPVSVMGAAKRLAEAFVANVHASDTGVEAMAVRFGNVFGSRGSVAPIFAGQIANGGPVTVTHPKMERYFMLVEDAVRLILTGAARWGADASVSPVFLLEMGEPVNILALAHRMIEVAGRTEDVTVRITQPREGEKLTEALHDSNERVFATDLEGIWRVEPVRALRPMSDQRLRELEVAAQTRADAIVKQSLFALLDDHLGRETSAAG